MSKSNAIKTFRDLLSFLTIIPLAQTEDFLETSARNIFLFPLVGSFIGLLGAGYLLGIGFILSYLLAFVTFLTHLPTGLLLRILPPAMTLAFLLIITGFQHFDGLVDLGNALGLKKVEDRREIAHRWVVTYRGALFAILVEFAAFAGLFLLNENLAIRALIVAEVCAKLSMVTIVWRGKPSHAGLGARFIEKANRKLNVLAYLISFIVCFLLLGIAGLIVVSIAALFGLFMVRVGKNVFGGVSGDMIGATNEASRALTLIVEAGVTIFVSILFTGALML
jgi:adenosylcobinamide-GDP ribazoletransferase